MSHDQPGIAWTDPRVHELLDALGLAAGSPDIAAIGWATVDLERAENELGGEWLAAPPDRLLGAAVHRSTDNEPPILLLEPDTEGRLAGALARYGEGPVALYIQAATRAAPTPRKTRFGSGPFGPERLVLDGSPAGPFLIIVEAAEAAESAAHPAREDSDRVPSEP
ncbi:MAG TPA: hypothetical protein VIB99_00860 [Candidatus Limnocylindrales bacterium]